MSKLQFVIIGAPEGENTIDLAREIERRGHACRRFKLSDLVIDFAAGKSYCQAAGFDLRRGDVFLFRAYNRNFTEACILASYLLQESKVVVDELLGRGMVASKTYEACRLTQSGIPVPRTYQALSSSGWEDVLSAAGYPAVVKPLCGQKGRGVDLLKDEEEARVFFHAHPTGYLLQEYLPAASDLRVLVAGGEALGAIRRFPLPGDFRANVSLGGRAEAFTLTSEMADLACAAARALGIELAGVDILECGQRPYVLEVNATPQWQGFKQATGINPAEAIINYCLEKYDKQ